MVLQMQMHVEKRVRVNLLLIREAFLFLCKGGVGWVGRELKTKCIV